MKGSIGLPKWVPRSAFWGRAATAVRRGAKSAAQRRSWHCPAQAQLFAETGVVTLLNVLVRSPDAVTALLSQIPIALS